MKKLLFILSLLTGTVLAQNYQPELNIPADSATILMTQKELFQNSSLQMGANRSATPEAVTSPVVDTSKVYWWFIISCLENQPAGALNSSSAPYMIQLANMGANFTNYFSLGHPSQPNYYRNFYGISIVTDNLNHGTLNRSEKSLYDCCKENGLNFENYIEGYPSVGYLGFQTGTYYRKHNAVLSDASVNPACCKPISMLPTDLSTLPHGIYFITPDINNSGHDTNVPYSDNYEKTNAIIQRVILYVKNAKAVFVNQYDEGSSSDSRIFHSFYGQPVKAGVTITTSLNQYDFVNLLTDWTGSQRINTAATRPANIRMDKWHIESVPVDTTPPTDTTTHPPVIGDSCKIARVNHLSIPYDSIFHHTGMRDSVYTDSIWTACPTIDSSYFIRGFYEQFFDQTAKSTAFSDALVRDIKAKKITDLWCYNVGGNATSAQYHGLITKIKALCPTIHHIIDCTTNGMPHDGFDGVNNEAEFWTAGSNATQDAAWNNDKTAFFPVTVAMKQLKEICLWHFGWFNTALTAAQCPKYLIDNMSYIMFHYYRAAINDLNYLKSRLDALQVVATRMVDFLPYISSELVFGQNWPGTAEDWYNNYFLPWFNAQHYTKIRPVGYGVFTRQLYDVKHPVPASTPLMAVTNMFRAKANRNPDIRYEGFKADSLMNTWAVDSVLMNNTTPIK